MNPQEEAKKLFKEFSAIIHNDRDITYIGDGLKQVVKKLCHKCCDEIISYSQIPTDPLSAMWNRELFAQIQDVKNQIDLL